MQRHAYSVTVRVCNSFRVQLKAWHERRRRANILDVLYNVCPPRVGTHGTCPRRALLDPCKARHERRDYLICHGQAPKRQAVASSPTIVRADA